MTTYIIIEDYNIHHEGDERSRKYPGHGYPAYTETVQKATAYDDYDEFYQRVCDLTKSQNKFKAFSAEEMSVTTSVVINITETSKN